MSKTTLISICLATAFVASCESIKLAEERDEALAAPINCATTAKGDLRVLESEQTHVAALKAMNRESVWPSTIAFGDGYGPAGGVSSEEASQPWPDGQTEVGLYEQAVNNRIAAIKSECGL